LTLALAEQLPIPAIPVQVDTPAIVRSKPFRRELVDRDAWLIELEEHTKTHRMRVAAKHAFRAQLALQSGDERVRFKPLPIPADSDPFTSKVLVDLNAIEARRLHEHAPDPRAQALAAALGIPALDAQGRPTAAHRPLPYAHVDDVRHPRGSVSGFHWHKQREQGQRERFARVRRCGLDRMRHWCVSCQHPGPDIQLACDQHRLCLSCRSRRAHKFQTRMTAALELVRDDLERMQLNRPTRVRANGTLIRGGEWSEKFLTLTLPHSGDIAADVRELPRAWRRFWRALRMHFQKDVLAGEDRWERLQLMPMIRFVRVIEVTEGVDGLGHAHLHVYLVGPYIDKYRLAHLWGEALSKSYQAALAKAGAIHPLTSSLAPPAVLGAMAKLRENLVRRGLNRIVIDRIIERERGWYVTCRGKHGKPLALLWAPVVDIRQVVKDGPVRDGQIARSNVSSELCKYLIKDCSNDDGRYELLEPSVYARIYAALEGRRAIAASRYLLTPIKKPCFCSDCGGQWRRWIEVPGTTSAPRGPPEQMILPGVKS
jgi:hypothetical protein